MTQDFTYLNNDAFRKICDHCFWHDGAPLENAAFRSGDIVFCKIDEVWRIFRALRRSRKRIVLVTGEGFKPVTPELYRQKPPHVSHWFGTNMFANADDVTPIPLGVGNAAGGSALRPEEFPAVSPAAGERTRLLCANFTIHTNPSIRGPLARWAASQSWISWSGHGGARAKQDYVNALRDHRFVLCPPGAGEDTHRMWEALYCGAIPVVRESPPMRGFADLPILFLSNLDAVTEQVLQDTLARFSKRDFALEKLNSHYWKKRFSAAKEEAMRLGPLSAKDWTRAWIQEALRIARRRA